MEIVLCYGPFFLAVIAQIPTRDSCRGAGTLLDSFSGEGQRRSIYAVLPGAGKCWSKGIGRGRLAE